MTRKRADPFPHTNWMRDRHGGERCILRVPGRKSITLKGWNNRLRAEASPLFAAQYRDAMAGVEPVEKKGLGIPKSGTLAALRVLIYKHAYFTTKRLTTQRSLSSYIDRIAKAEGDKPFALLRTEDVQRRVNLFAAAGKPAAARNLLNAFRLLQRVAVDAGLRKKDDDPTAGVELPRIKGKGYRPWTDDECATYEKKHPLGTRKRLLYAFHASTALRGGDVARVGRQHIRPRKNVISIGPYKVTHDLELPAMEKTGEPIKLPVLPQLQAAIDAMGPANNLPFFTGPDGVTPLTTKRLRAILREAVFEAGLDPVVCDDTGRPKGLSGHGLRKHMAKKLAEEIGCSEHEIAAVLGHKDLRQVRTYTAGANKDQMAERALLKLLANLAAEQPETSHSHTAPAGTSPAMTSLE
jgi:integrase